MISINVKDQMGIRLYAEQNGLAWALNKWKLNQLWSDRESSDLLICTHFPFTQFSITHFSSNSFLFSHRSTWKCDAISLNVCLPALVNMKKSHITCFCVRLTNKQNETKVKYNTKEMTPLCKENSNLSKMKKKTEFYVCLFPNQVVI